MIKTLLASTALVFAMSAPSFALAPSADHTNGLKAKTEYNDMEAKRSKKRIPGGSGCDDPRDVIEHPECRPTASLNGDVKNSGDQLIQEAKRSKKRIPGGSGCDTPQDVAEHPECRV
jgi:hypothetical protein